MINKMGKKKFDKPLLELVMIVKNAENVIVETLLGIKDYIDSFTILDTGSLDRTVELIKETLKDVEGCVYEEPFINFSTSRNRVLELAGNKCEYTIMLDDTYVLNGGKELRKVLKTKKKDCYSLRIVDESHNNIYYSNRIFNTSKNIRYKYRVHEVPDNDNDIQIQNDAVFLFDKNNLTRSRSLERYQSDIENMLLDLKDYPNDARILYHLAQAYELVNQTQDSILTFLKAIKIQTSKNMYDEVLYHSYYNLANLLYRENHDWKKIEDYYIKAFNVMNRAEPLFHIGAHYYYGGNLEYAYNVLEKASKIPIPMNVDYEVDMNIYLIKIPYLILDISLILNKVPKDEKLFQRINSLVEKNPKISHFKNIKEMIFPSSPKQIIRYNNYKTLVFHTEFVFGIWDPKNPSLTQYVSGSEIMAKNLGIHLSKLGFKVFIFGNFVDFNYNYECKIDGVEFLDNTKYKSWIETHYIDYLIVSRNPTNVYYLPNIQNVYLWIHDVYPLFEFVQSHRTKFKGVFSLCNWHKKCIADEFSIPLNQIKVTRNAIDILRFQKDVEKTPLRFIYSSSPDRGLSYLLQLFPKIVERYPEATLHIFCNHKFISNSDLESIKKHDSIFLNKRVNQEQIAEEYLKSDFWFYPTGFTETYCITAVEAQAAGCMCVTLDIGSLKEIVGDRGIVLEGKISDKHIQNELLESIFKVIDNPELKNSYIKKGREWALKQTYESLAEEWSQFYLN